MTRSIVRILALLLLWHSWASAEIIHRERSADRNIIVKQTAERRCLVFSVKRQHRNQTCIDIEHPRRIVFPYVRMTFAGLLVQPDPKRILMIGLGGGTISNVLIELYPEAKLDLVEINEGVIRVAREYFGFRETDNTEVHIVDGRVFTRRAALNAKQYDLVILDAFTGEYIPEHLMTKEFLEDAKAILAPGGVLVANTFSKSTLYDHESVTYAEVFGIFINFKMPGTGNRVIVASASKLPNHEVININAKDLSPMLAPYQVDLKKFIPYLKRDVDWNTTRRALTDQYSPANLLKGAR